MYELDAVETKELKVILDAYDKVSELGFDDLPVFNEDLIREIRKEFSMRLFEESAKR